MPEGVAVVVEDGVATIEAVDSAQRGRVAEKLLEHTPPELVQKRTRPRHAYRVPVEYARAAGLIDGPAEFDDGGLVPEGGPAVNETGDADVVTGHSGGEPNVGAEVPLGESAELVGDGTGQALPPVPDNTFVPGSTPLDAPELLVGDPTPAPEPDPTDPGVEPESKGYDDGEPDMDWRRADINAYAAKLTPPLDTTDQPSKPTALAAIKKAIEDGATRPAPGA